MTLAAPAKLNLALYLGPRREDGLHELCSLTQALTLSDRLSVREADADEVLCPGVEGPNLVTRAIRELRRRGWSRPPLRVEIEKRIPVAAGLGGGSADAAALLRLARADGVEVADVAAELGADVPAQLDPGCALVRGAGELVERQPRPAEHGIVVVPSPEGLSTAEVYAEADRLGLGRDAEGLDEVAGRLRAAAGRGGSPLDYAELLVNDLQPATLSLRPEVANALSELEAHGAERALVTGSGPSAFGLFGEVERAERAAAELSARFAGAVATAPSPRE